MTYRAETYYLHEHGDHPLVVRTDDDIDALIDALMAESFDHSLANLYIVERPLNTAGVPDHEFGVAVDAEREVGGLWYLGAGGSWYSLGARSDRDEVYYCYMGNDTGFPLDSEIPLNLIRQAAKEFLDTGGERPTCVSWQPCRRQ